MMIASLSLEKTKLGKSRSRIRRRGLNGRIRRRGWSSLVMPNNHET